MHPRAGSHASVVHTFPSSHFKGVPTHLPERHTSSVQALPSLHEFVSSGAYTHPVAGLHESSVHGLLSLHVTGSVAHRPATHASIVH